MIAQDRFWSGKRVLITGHTGFKGSWAALWLQALGAKVSGLALEPDTEPSLFRLAGLDALVDHHVGDIRDRSRVDAVVDAVRPEIVLHMAAQALVRRSYREPAETFAVNVMGSVNLLDSLRRSPEVRSVLVVTSDKVYANDDSGCAFAEGDRLGGHDPYAASKAAVELVVAAYAQSFFDARDVALATVRGGNVIGGGDFSEDRIVPDLWRAARTATAPRLRHPDATRPWQHVLDCLAGYFAYAQALMLGAKVPRALNIGPDPWAALPVKAVADAVLAAFDMRTGWTSEPGWTPHEMRSLSIDPGLAHATLGWRDLWPGSAALGKTADWYRAFDDGVDVRQLMLADIAAHALAVDRQADRELTA